MSRPAHSKAFEDAITLKRVGDGRYTAKLLEQWSIGTAPNGGYLLAVLYRLAIHYLADSHPQQHNADPWPIGMQVSYVNRSQVGHADLSVRAIKLGRRSSTLHVSLTQKGKERVVGYVTVSDPVADAGLSLPTRFKLHPAPPSTRPPRLDPHQQPTDGIWTKKEVAHPEFRRAPLQLHTYVPHDAEKDWSVLDQWARLWPLGPDGGPSRWTRESAAFLLDIFGTTLTNLEAAGQPILYPEDAKTNPGGQPRPIWFPTVTLNAEFKKRLPPEGLEWLSSRVTIKSLRNGRMDVELLQMDEEGELVAIMTQSALVLDQSRNAPQQTKASL